MLADATVLPPGSERCISRFELPAVPVVKPALLVELKAPSLGYLRVTTFKSLCPILSLIAARSATGFVAFHAFCFGANSIAHTWVSNVRSYDLGAVGTHSDHLSDRQSIPPGIYLKLRLSSCFIVHYPCFLQQISRPSGRPSSIDEHLC